MNHTNEIEKIIEEVKKQLTIQGRAAVFENGKSLSSEHIQNKSDPEGFTEDYLIKPILNLLKIKPIRRSLKFLTPNGTRKVDFLLRNSNGEEFLLEAKPINSTKIDDKTDDSAVNQIIGIFKLRESEKYSFGIATDGMIWIIFNNKGEKIGSFNIIKEFDKIKQYLTGESEIPERIEEEISKKFYEWYNSLLHGGKYKDHNNKTQSIPESECLVKNILRLDYQEDAEQIAQVIMDRLIFIKFLQSKQIVKKDVLEYLYKLDEHLLNEMLKQLFFSVLNTPKIRRVDINPRFMDIPYLNGSLFNKTEAENRNPDYRMKAEILNQVLIFLDNFSFIHNETGKIEKILDPEILGYIFEKAMTATDRKGTGAYYTPKTITKYIAENTIHPFIIDKTNEILKEKKLPEIKSMEDLYKLKKGILWDVQANIAYNIKICDNACGSGAFLLAAANILWNIHKNLKDLVKTKYSDAWLKLNIIKNNLYGVDINPNAVEIAKLRLWLWVVDSYEPEKVEPLPNIDYNIRCGNSLIGYTDISRFKEVKTNIHDHIGTEKSLFNNLRKREDILKEYKTSSGNEAKNMKSEIDEIDRRIKILLNMELLKEFEKHKIEIIEKDLESLKPFHWAAEFYDIFNPTKPKEERGFDIIIGNPPYLSFTSSKTNKNIGPKDIYELLIGKYRDLYEYFLVHSIKLFKGYISFIIPNNVIFSPLIESLKKNIVSFDNIGEGIFEGANTSVCIIKINSKTNEKFKFINYIYMKDKKSKIGQVSSIEINDFNFNKNDTIIKIIENSSKQISSLNTKITRGEETGKKSLSLIKQKTYEPIYTANELLPFILKPARYFIDPKNVQKNFYCNEKIGLTITFRKRPKASYLDRVLTLKSIICLYNIKQNEMKNILAFINSKTFNYYNYMVYSYFFEKRFNRIEDIYKYPYFNFDKLVNELVEYLMENYTKDVHELLEYVIYEEIFRTYLKTNLVNLLKKRNLKDSSNLLNDRVIQKELSKIKSNDIIKMIEKIHGEIAYGRNTKL